MAKKNNTADIGFEKEIWKAPIYYEKTLIFQNISYYCKEMAAFS